MAKCLWRLIWPIFLFLFLSGCPKDMRYRPIAPLSPEIALKDLVGESARRMQVSGTFLARASGIKRFLGSVELDVVAQAPESLYISMRSFFSQPARVFAADSKQMYLLEMTDLQKPSFRAHPVNGEDIEDVLPLPLSPKEVVEVVLGIAPVAGAEVVDLIFDERQDSYTLKLRQANGFFNILNVRMPDHVLLRRALHDNHDRPIYSVTYQDFRYVSGLDFAHRWDFSVNLKGKTHGVSLFATDITVNGEPFGADTFRLDPP